MADERTKSEALRQRLLKSRTPALKPDVLRAAAVLPRPGISVRPTAPQPTAPSPPVRPAPTPRPASPVAPQPSGPPPTVAAAPSSNPFTDLPFPSPGDRIKADDFKKLSQSLRIIYDAYGLAGSFLGRSFAEARLALGSQQYQITKVMTVFGSEITDPNDASLDGRRVIHIAPTAIGERSVAVILTEAVENRRLAPNLLGLTYREASERLHATLGEVTFPTTNLPASQLVGLSLAEAKQTTQG